MRSLKIGNGKLLVALVALSAVLPAIGLASRAEADVIAIGDDGAVIARTGQGDVRWSAVGDRAGKADGSADLDLAAAHAFDPALTLVGNAAIPARYIAATIGAAAANGLSAALLAAVVWQESRWHQDARSAAGAIGLAQLMPATAGSLGVDPRDPVANLYGAAHYMRFQIDRFGGDLEKALAAYNAGPARVARSGGIPAVAETRAYVASIMGRLSENSSHDGPVTAKEGN